MLIFEKALQRQQKLLVKVGKTVSPKIENRVAFVKI